MDVIPQPKRLIPHLASCFSGAAVDNVYRVAAVAALTAAAANSHGDRVAAELAATHLSTWAMVAFTVPFVLFAPLAGGLGDRMPKHILMRWVRFADLPVLALGGLGLWTGHIWFLLAALVLLGTTSSFFSPVKLSCVPELVPSEGLAVANAWVQGVTIAAIVIGMGLAMLGDPSVHLGMHPALAVTLIGLVIAAIGLVGAFMIPPLPAQDRGARLRPWAFVSQARVLFERPGLAVPAFSLAGFWGLAAAVGVLIAPVAKFAWGLDAMGPSLLGLCLMAGIIVGAAIAPLLMSAMFTAGLPIIGALIAGGSLLAGGWIACGAIADPHPWLSGQPIPPSLIGFGGMLALAGLGSGLWDVPMNVLLQQRSDPASRNRVMAAVGIATSVGMVVASLACNLLADWFHLSSGKLVFLLGGVAVAFALGGAWLYRGQLVGWVGCILVRLLFKVEVVGAEKVPATGGCLIASNHQSLADGAILAAVLPRRARFMVFRWYCELPLIGWALRNWGVVPVDAKGGARALVAAVEAATAAAREGGVVGVFPEGKLTRSGLLDVFKPGIEHIAQRAGVPIVPCAIDGLWRSPYSFAAKGHRDWWRPRLRVQVRLGDPLPPDTPAAELRQAVSALFNQIAQEATDRDQRTIGARALRRCRIHPFGVAITDAQGSMPRWQVAGVALALRPRLGLAADEGAVGLLLPPGRAGAVANLAVALLGRTAVNLNHTVGASQLKRMCEMAGIRTIISAKPYLKRIGDPGLACRMVMLDEVLPTIPKAAILGQAISLWLCPSTWRDRARPGEVAALVFSSGSTGDPKGVQITHRQVLANCDAVSKALDLGDRDVLLSPLPLFHSFGLIPGMWLALVKGMGVAAHPDPTDAKGLGDLAQKTGATFSITTATFVRGWMRRIPAEQFKHLRFAVAGAEKCPADLRAAFKAKYGGALLEGYGCTELAPTVSTSLLPVTSHGETEIRERDGAVGRPLPGMHVLVIDPATREPLPTGKEGLLVVRSPSRMLGYLGRPDLDAKVFSHGGYDTGDIGTVDAEGFIRITGRLARFAKIGGEMVPLDTIEGVLQAAMGDRAEVAVAAVPDPDRGERLIVLVAGEEAIPADELLKPAAELAPLWRPKSRDVHRVPSLPRLGTGKRDLAGVKRMAAEAAAG